MKQDPSRLPHFNDPRLKTVRVISKLMDEQFSIGRFKFGLDPVLNFIPVLGDVSGYLMSIGLIITMAQHGASGKLVAKMVLNATLDAFAGAIPVLGWVFDFVYKANTRNLKLLTEHYTEGKHKGSARSVIFAVLLVAAGILVLLVILAIKFLQWIIEWDEKSNGLKFNF
ncbi:DUF4112 domain-containing protein [Niabella drilacis]|uniref:DUF4112 domain-containing protein n=1 Tax=Niabella drilacis (strain DSM 25811 / CCM 8410 / CCUG 62505 / LMG 26954 / E90) TaxID=1285928 RepID=A0A1G6QZY4_NIADE|nr:DUF4112 domain-containing protein [Niabella drilacis]SDC97912.1 protein of unknown function [Niabella drilacis]